MRLGVVESAILCQRESSYGFPGFLSLPSNDWNAAFTPPSEKWFIESILNPRLNQ